MTAPKKMVRSFINLVFLTRMFKNYSLVFFYVVVLLLSIRGNCSVDHGFLIDQKDSLKVKLLDSCKIYSKQKKYDKAYKVAQELNDFALEIKDTALLLNSYYRMGYYAYNAKNPIKAIQHYTAGIDLKTSPKYNTHKINLFYNKTSDLNTIGDFKEAQKTAIDGLTIARQVKDTTAMIDFYNKLAISLAKNFEFNDSETAYLKALQLETNNQNKARILNNIGVLYKHQNKYYKAVKIYDSIQTKIKYDSPLLEASIKSNLGYALTQINNKKRAILLLNQALTTRTELEDNNGLFASYIHLYNYYKNDNYTKAALYANEALAIATQKTKSPNSEKEALSHLVSLQVASKIETNRFFFLTDSIARSKQKTINDYTAAKFQSKEKELENLTLRNQKSEQEKLIAQQNKRNWQLGIGLALAITGMGIFFYYYRRNKKQKQKIEALQKELHHRLKNNLAFIDVFIGLAKDKFKDADYQEKLTELQNRIKSMFEVHQQLFEKENITTVNASKYITKLTDNIKNAYINDNITISKNIDASKELDSQTSFPLGIIINEFITNSYKYAFNPDEKGLIKIALKDIGRDYSLTLSDNGKGLPSDFDVQSITSFGLDSIKLLTQEYHGTFALNGQNGVTLQITLPKKVA